MCYYALSTLPDLKQEVHTYVFLAPPSAVLILTDFTLDFHILLDLLCIDSGLGQIIIDTDVIATYAGSVAVECFGIIGMAAVSMKDGLVKLLGRNSLKHGISVSITEDNKIRLNFHVIVAYGVNVSTIADNLVSNVKYKVEAFTGMEIDKIDIFVEGVRAID